MREAFEHLSPKREKHPTKKNKTFWGKSDGCRTVRGNRNHRLTAWKTFVGGRQSSLAQTRRTQSRAGTKDHSLSKERSRRQVNKTGGKRSLPPQVPVARRSNRLASGHPHYQDKQLTTRRREDVGNIGREKNGSERRKSSFFLSLSAEGMTFG